MNAESRDELGSLIASIKACSRSRNINDAKQLHSGAILKGSISNKYVANCLITAYAKCRSVASAARVFDSMISRDLVSWNALLQGYVECGEIESALQLFHEMPARDGRSYVSALHACSTIVLGVEGNRRVKLLENVRAMHREALETRCCDSFMKCSLVSFYSKAGWMKEARGVFDELNEPDTAAWNALLQGYVANGESELALQLLDENSFARDARTFVIGLNACADLSSADQAKWLSKGRRFLCEALETRSCDIFVECAAIDMFAKSRSMEEARQVFDRMPKRNAVSWTALLNGYIANEASELALELFQEMVRAGECGGDDGRVFIAALQACSSLASKEQRAPSRSIWLNKGREIHKLCSFRDVFVETALVNMYAQCGSMEEARLVFNKMNNLDSISWNSLIQGYVDNGRNLSALKTLSEMDLSGAPPTSATFVAALTACKNEMLVPQGRELHSEIEARGGVNPGDSALATTLLEFYCKSGSMADAELVFASIKVKETSLWNCLMGGYCQRGDHSRAFELFRRMRERGVPPDKFTFSNLLAACSHGGLTSEARSLFDAMRYEFRIQPDLKHYTCMVDLLSRANCLEEAAKMIAGMPHQPDNVIWSTLLNAAGGDKAKLELGEVAFEKLMRMDRDDASAYVSLARAYHPKDPIPALAKIKRS